jgi:hypothetical protein
MESTNFETQDTPEGQKFTEPEYSGQGSQAEPPMQIDPVFVEIMQESGIELFDGDPELATLDWTQGKHKLCKSIEAACEAKKARLTSTTKEPIQPNLPAAHKPANGGSSGSEKKGYDYLRGAHERTSRT